MQTQRGGQLATQAFAAPAVPASFQEQTWPCDLCGSDNPATCIQCSNCLRGMSLKVRKTACASLLVSSGLVSGTCVASIGGALLVLSSSSQTTCILLVAQDKVNRNLGILLPRPCTVVSCCPDHVLLCLGQGQGRQHELPSAQQHPAGDASTSEQPKTHTATYVPPHRQARWHAYTKP